MVKSFSEYIKEHFGAITVEYPPEHMVVKNPNLPQPLSINTWVGGTGRIPKQWNNSPYLSGGFGGSGYGRFGQDPVESTSNELDNYLNTLYEIDSILSNFQNDEYVKIALNLKKDIEDGKVIPNWDNEGPEESRLHDLGIETEIEIIEYPIPGTSSTYHDPGDPGESGEYETSITGTSSGSEQDNQELERILGVNSIEDIPTLDEIAAGVLNDALYIRKTCYDLGMEETANWLIDSANSIESNLQRLYEEKDTEYFENEGSIQSEYELYDLADEAAYDSLKYLIRFSMIDNKSNRLDANQEIREKVKGLARPIHSDDLINMLKQVIELPWDIQYQQRKHFK